MTDPFSSHAETVMAVPKSKTSTGVPSALNGRDKGTRKTMKSDKNLFGIEEAKQAHQVKLEGRVHDRHQVLELS